MECYDINYVYFILLPVDLAFINNTSEKRLYVMLTCYYLRYQAI